MAQTEIITTADRPDLIPEIGHWLWREWGVRRGRSEQDIRDRLASHRAPHGPGQCLVLLADGRPAATASLVYNDLDARPDLNPWLASVYTHPDFRHLGYAARLVRAAEASITAASIPVFYLYSNTATALYARLGWEAFGDSVDLGAPVVLMRRTLGGGGSEVR